MIYRSGVREKPHVTREAWDKQQQEYAEFSAAMDRKQAEREAAGETKDPFASAWSGIRDADDDGNRGVSPFTRKQGGHLKMAFMVAEIVAELESCNAPRDEIKSINECFADYRRSDDEQLSQRSLELKANLQSLADRYPGLISKSADLQSRIDESQRSPAIDQNEFDFPF